MSQEVALLLAFVAYPPTVSAPDGHGMILIKRCVACIEDATYRVVYAGLVP